MKKVMISQPMNCKTNEQILVERHKLASELAEEGLQVIDTVIKEDAPKDIDEAINQKEEEIKSLEAEMLKDENNTDYVKLKELEENVQKLNFEIEAKMKEWEELNSELERIENQN